MNTRNIVVGVTLLFVSVACGGASVPHSQMADSQASVRAAEAMAAHRLPRGELHLKLARDQIQQAQRMIEQGANEEAAVVLRRARADAELALAVAQAERARADAERASEEIKELQERH